MSTQSLNLERPRLIAPVALAGCVACVLLAIVSVDTPKLLILPVVALVGPLLLSNAQFRLTFVILGGMAVLQSSAELDLAKLGYFGGAFLAIISAAVRTLAQESDVADKMRPLCRVALLTITFILGTFVIATTNGAGYVDWLRDAAPYLLAASVPFLAVDAAREEGSRQFAMFLFISVGLVAAASFFVDWVDNRRGLADLPLDRLLLPTFAPAAALFFYASARTFFAERVHIGWFFLALLIPATLVLTATRSSAILIVGPLVLILLRTELISRISGRLLAMIVAAILVALTVAPTLSGTLDLNIVTYRFSTVSQVISDPGSDRSYTLREAQTKAAWRQFLAYPVVGTGPGLPIQWYTLLRTSESSFNVDTGLSFLSKFGFAGIVLVIAWALAFKASWRRITPSLGSAPVRFTLIAFLVHICAGALFSNPLEDKGVSFTLLLLMVLALTTKGSADGEAANRSKSHV
jgi:hypothetical protein